MSLIVVVGATGAQGGSVINQFKESLHWKVRGITRNVKGDKAIALSQQGIEMVAANIGDESSLVQAFKGATAIFAVTTFWEFIPELGRDGAGELELQQFINMAKAASATPTLQHYVVSSLPSASKISQGKYPVPHFDYKAKGVEWMATHTPELWAKTTELWAGAYTSNLAFYPISKFVPILDSGSYVLMAPASPSSVFPLAGDMQINCGIVVKAIIEAGSKALGKVVVLVTDYVPFKEIASEFEIVTGKSAIYLEVSDEDFSRVWGPFGTELACHLRWGEHYSDWNAFSTERVLSLEELGVAQKLVSFKEAMEGLKGSLL